MTQDEWYSARRILAYGVDGVHVPRGYNLGEPVLYLLLAESIQKANVVE